MAVVNLKRIAIRISVLLLALVASAFGYFFLIIDRSNSPECHKILYSGFNLWAEDHTNEFPNVNGGSLESFRAMDEELGNADRWAERYNYVPGLRKGDPEDLILMYLKRPTRWIHHVSPQTIFKEKRWMIAPLLGFSDEAPMIGEFSQRISTAEFRQRLQQTLDFVRTNQRPNWERVAEEHTKFLQTIAD